MVTEYLLTLPAELVMKPTASWPFSCVFNLRIFKNHSRELRLCYEMDPSEEEPPIIPWEEPNTIRRWIFLMEGIDDDTCFVEAVKYVLHELTDKAHYFENPFKFTTTKA